MIQAVMVISTQAKPRLLKFYNFQVPKPCPLVYILSFLHSSSSPLSLFTTHQVVDQFSHPDQPQLDLLLEELRQQSKYYCP